MSEIWDSDDIDSVGHDDCISVNDHDSALKEIQKEIAALQAENAELRKALEDIATGFGDIEVPEEVRQLAEQALTRAEKGE